MYRIQCDYHTYLYKGAVKQLLSLQIIALIPVLLEMIQMSTQKIL